VENTRVVFRGAADRVIRPSGPRVCGEGMTVLWASGRPGDPCVRCRGFFIVLSTVLSSRCRFGVVPPPPNCVRWPDPAPSRLGRHGRHRPFVPPPVMAGLEPGPQEFGPWLGCGRPRRRYSWKSGSHTPRPTTIALGPSVPKPRLRVTPRAVGMG